MFTLILLIIAVCTILTYIVPAGQYDTYVDDNGVEVFVDGSYHRVEQTPVTPMKALMSVTGGHHRDGQHRGFHLRHRRRLWRGGRDQGH